MPLYDRECQYCGHTQANVFEDCEDRGDEHGNKKCPLCGRLTFLRLLGGFSINVRAFNKPIEMLSIAMEDPQEIADFAAKCPDVTIERNPDHEMYGVPVARHRKAKLQALKAAGFSERN